MGTTKHVYRKTMSQVTNKQWNILFDLQNERENQQVSMSVVVIPTTNSLSVVRIFYN